MGHTICVQACTDLYFVGVQEICFWRQLCSYVGSWGVTWQRHHTIWLGYIGTSIALVLWLWNMWKLFFAGPVSNK